MFKKVTGQYESLKRRGFDIDMRSLDQNRLPVIWKVNQGVLVSKMKMLVGVIMPMCRLTPGLRLHHLRLLPRPRLLDSGIIIIISNITITIRTSSLLR
jgi:hypothetical protein